MKTTFIAVAALGLAFAGSAVAQTAGTRADSAQDPATATATGESKQPVSDTWITTKVKTELMSASDVPGTDIKVETVNGVVKLSGSVDKSQAEKAASIARNVDGVKKVDTTALMAARK